MNKNSLFLILSTVFFFSCSSKSNEEKSTFDRSAFLTQTATQIILPAFTELHTSVSNLDQSIQVLISTPNETHLLAAKNAWKQAFLSWQNATPFNFGPAGEEGLSKSLTEEMGTFPVSESKIATRLSSGSFNVNDFDRDARGLFVVEYLIFGRNQSNTEILTFFSDTKYTSFLSAVSANILSRVSAVLSAWSAQEIADFVANNGTDAGSSTSIYYNEYVKSYEALKNFKVQVPMGLRPGQTQREPHLVEAYYSGHSIEGLKAHFETMKRVWNGAENGIGFKAYLQTVTGGADLISGTEAQFLVVDATLDAIQNAENLSELIENQDARLNTLQIELQKLTRYLKSDLSSLIGIAITYSSGDGD